MVAEVTSQGFRTAGVWVGKVTGSGGIATTYVGMQNSASWLINGTEHRSFSSVHVGGAHFLFADGRVRFLSENINGATYASLATRAGNEPTFEY